MTITDVRPTAFFVREGADLKQIVEFGITNAPEAPVLRYAIGSEEGESPLTRTGEGTWRAPVPDVRTPCTARFSIHRHGGEGEHCDVSRPWRPGRHWQVCFVPVAHHDYGYTRTIATVLKQYEGYYEDVLGYCDATTDYPDEARFRYQVEQAWSLVHTLEVCSPETRERLIARMRDGSIEVPALLGNQITNLCGHEELVRLLYPSFEMKRRYGVPVTTAAITDIPGLSWALPSALASAGVRCFLAGLPTYFEWAEVKYHNFWDERAIFPQGRPGAFWWEGPDGARVLTYYHGGYGVWTPRSVAEVNDALPEMLADLEARAYPFDVIRAGYNGMDNQPPDMTCCDIAREWNATWAFPKLIVGTNATFFGQLAQTADLPVVRGELPDTDYVVGAISSAKETGLNRTTHSLLPAAEALHAVADGPDEYPAEEIADAWYDVLMFDEHTWGMETPAGPHQDWDWADKAAHAYRGAARAESLLMHGAQRIASRIRGNEPGRIVVFNTLSAQRTGPVYVPAFRSDWTHRLNPEIGVFGSLPDGPFEVVDDESGEVVPHQIVRPGDMEARHSDGMRALSERPDVDQRGIVFLARNVPPVGFRSYVIRPCEAERPLRTDVSLGEHFAENASYRIEIEPQTGRVVRLFDKETARELADDTCPWGMGDLLARKIRADSIERMTEARVERIESGECFARIVITGRLRGCPAVRQEIRLWHDIKRIDFVTRVIKGTEPMLDHLIAFPFAAGRPRFLMEGTNSVMAPITDQVPGSNTETYAVQNYVSAADGGLRLTLSPRESHLVSLGRPWTSYVSPAHHAEAPADFGKPFRLEPPKEAHVFVWAMTNNFRTNFRAMQSGDCLFSVSLTSDVDGAPSAPRDFGAAVHTPLYPAATDVHTADDLPPAGSFVRIGPENVTLQALKRAEDGNGLVIRLRETEGAGCRATITPGLMKMTRAWLTNVVEENVRELVMESGAVRVDVQPWEVVTVRVAAG